MSDLLVTHIGQLATLDQSLVPPSNVPQYSPDPAEKRLGIVTDGALAIECGRIAWLGSTREIPERFRNFPELDAGGGLVTPGLIDCHTHLVFAGARYDEYTLRALGKSYQTIAAEGGGIKATTKKTREATFETLYNESKLRLLRMMELGTSTIEVKSGYGLDLDTEVRTLEVVAALGTDLPARVVPTFLGAHEIPVEYLENGKRTERAADRYLDFVIERVLPVIAERGLAKFCDVFCEAHVFSTAQAERILAAGQRVGLKPKIHAEELEFAGGSLLAAKLNAVSADHLTKITRPAIEAMIERGVVFVLLPGTAVFLGLRDLAPAREIIDAGGKVALATDRNPGSSTVESLPLIGTLAVSLMRMTPAEALEAMTANAARALLIDDQVGKLTPGLAGDLAVFRYSNFQELVYNFGINKLSHLVIGGEVVVNRN